VETERKHKSFKAGLAGMAQHGYWVHVTLSGVAETLSSKLRSGRGRIMENLDCHVAEGRFNLVGSGNPTKTFL
jgi:hypothetical protein